MGFKSEIAHKLNRLNEKKDTLLKAVEQSKEELKLKKEDNTRTSFSHSELSQSYNKLAIIEGKIYELENLLENVLENNSEENKTIRKEEKVFLKKLKKDIQALDL